MPSPTTRARSAEFAWIFLAQGFRPFFLAAALWAALAMAVWIALWTGVVALPSALDPLTWHAHEFLFGFIAAAMAGFLLTAIPNWTGRLPVRGPALGLLAGLWLAGRIAVAASAAIGPGLAAAIDLAFLAVLLGTIAREIVVGRNWRNTPVAAAVGALTVANVLMHVEFVGLAATADLGLRLGLATVLALITMIGGRIVPSFTRNWLAKRGSGVLPRPFDRIDRAALAVTLAACLSWTLAPEAAVSGGLALVAAAANALRLARWCGHRTLAEPLLAVLHLAYAWLPVGFALLGAAVLGDLLPATAALHALTAGAMTTMIVAVMTRATLGHTGRALSAGPGTVWIYGLVTFAAILRVAAPALGVAGGHVLTLAGLSWIGAFALFLALYGPLLAGRPVGPAA